MNKINSSQQGLGRLTKQQKFLLVAPLLLFPFCTLIFWALGGGKGRGATAQTVKLVKGLNTELPAPNFKDEKDKSKLAFYKLAEKDSARLKSFMEKDPYYHPGDKSNENEKDNDHRGQGNTGYSKRNRPAYDPYPAQLLHDKDPNEEKVYRKIAELNRHMDEQKKQASQNRAVTEPEKTKEPSVNSQDIDRLETMMNMMTKEGEADPEMQQLDSMMQKIFDLQHPELVKERIRAQSKQHAGRVYPVTLKQEIPVSFLEVPHSKTAGDTSTKIVDSVPVPAQPPVGFYSLLSNVQTVQANAVEAIVAETQTITTGATIRLQVSAELYINGLLIPKGHDVYGKVVLSNGRLQGRISSIRYKNTLLPVDLTIYGTDGIEGLSVQDAMTSDVSKQSAQEAVNGIGLTALDPSFGAQAAAAGIETAKKLFSKKIRLVKVTIPAGRTVLLKDSNSDR